MYKNINLRPLKVIGIGIFIWIIWNIDTNQLLITLKSIRALPALVALICIIGIIIIKTFRWHLLVCSNKVHTTFFKSLRIYLIGIFLGTITPAKIGEIGKAKYLQKIGIPMRTGITLSIIDRISDVILIIPLGILGIGILTDTIMKSIVIIIVTILTGVFIYIMQRKKIRKLIRTETLLIYSKLALYIFILTIISWILYFTWAVLLARSIDISVTTITLVACFAVAASLTLLPIAPSGLGTRDATLLFFLVPYGIAPENVISVSMLMFFTILLMSIPGGILWINKKI